MENDNISKHSGLMGAIRHYSNPMTCLEEVASVKWPDGKVVCPRCNSKRITFLKTRLLWKCKDCQKRSAGSGDWQGSHVGCRHTPEASPSQRDPRDGCARFRTQHRRPEVL